MKNTHWETYEHRKKKKMLATAAANLPPTAPPL